MAAVVHSAEQRAADVSMCTEEDGCSFCQTGTQI